MHKTLIDPSTLSKHLHDPNWVVIDCRFDLANPEKGEEWYREAHIPGARYAHLDRHLSGPKTGTNGRHPLPDAETLCRTFGALGISNGKQVVAYDADSSMYAARLWWMLRWLGHAQVAVLDGGFAAWQQAGGAVTTESPLAAPGSFEPGSPLEEPLSAQQLLSQLGQTRLIDARAPERFRGEVEPLDTQAGHIPGAVNRFFKTNLGPDGRFKPAAQLREEFAALLGGAAAGTTVHQCGSGVTACHNLLAMHHAGLPGSRLYPGSWSEWSADPRLPLAKG